MIIDVMGWTLFFSDCGTSQMNRLPNGDVCISVDLSVAEKKEVIKKLEASL